MLHSERASYLTIQMLFMKIKGIQNATIKMLEESDNSIKLFAFMKNSHLKL